MPRRAEEPEAPRILGRRMRLRESSHRFRRVFRLGGLTVYNYRSRTDWMGSHESGIWVHAGHDSTPQQAADLLLRRIKQVRRRLTALLGRRQ